MSHPMWVRGLKHSSIHRHTLIHLSHPMWVRGLKLRIIAVYYLCKRRTLCGCVD